MDNDINEDKSPSQWLLKIIAGVEFLIAGLLSVLFLMALLSIIFTKGMPNHGHGYTIFALMFLTPILLLLWSASIISWRGNNIILAWVLQLSLLMMLVVFGLMS